MRPFLRVLTGCALCFVSACPQADARTNKCARNSHATADVPITLADGHTQRTPEFAVKRKRYLIEIEARKLRDSDELHCKLGLAIVLSEDDCKRDPVLEVDWRVLDGERVVAHGHDGGKSLSFEADSCYLARFIGEFQGESHHTYVLEITSTKDGTPLDVNDPHLVVLMDTGLAM